MSKCSGENVEDFRNVMMAKEKLEAVVLTVNEKTRQWESQAKTFEASLKIRGIENLVIPTRRLLIEGLLTVAGYDSGKKLGLAEELSLLVSNFSPLTPSAVDSELSSASSTAPIANALLPSVKKLQHFLFNDVLVVTKALMFSQDRFQYVEKYGVQEMVLVELESEELKDAKAVDDALLSWILVLLDGEVVEQLINNSTAASTITSLTNPPFFSTNISTFLSTATSVKLYSAPTVKLKQQWMKAFRDSGNFYSPFVTFTRHFQFLLFVCLLPLLRL